MKFGSQLKDALYPEWRSYYIDYDGLKKKLRKAERDKPFSEKDETEFVEALDNNLEKVYAFHQEKLNDIVSRIDQWDKALEELSKDGQNTSEEEMGKVQESINAIADDVNRLARFSRLNYTGFLKIVKKHDRHTNYILRPMFMVRLNQCPFWKQDDDPLLMKLSELFSKARHGGRVMSFKTPNSKEQNNVNTQAQSTRRIVVKRFFVHVDNVLELKTYVLRHLPALVYRDKSAREDDLDPPVSSLYLDNSSLDLYNERVEQTSGSQIVRLRWYGSARKNPSITVERRTLAEENRGELTDRFTIKYKYVSGYIAGDNTFIKKTADKMRKSVGISEQDVEKFEHLATEVQQLITQKNLQPVLRTYYKRTAFQIPGDNRVRMALDTDLCFIREDSGLFSDDSTVRRPDGNWLRPDADVDYPFVNVKPDSDVNRYPYATFEIKLLLGQDEEEPEWIIDLEESGLLEQAPQFSKFVHGMAILFDTRVALLPYWLASVDDDLQQIPLVPSQSSSASKKQQQDKGKKRAATPPAEESSLLARRKPSQATERTSLLGNDANQLPSYTGMNGSPPRTQVEEEETWTDFLKEIPRKLFNRNTDSQQQREPVQLPPGVKVPKKVITPLRVEPKVFFANERTYFSWMSLGSMLVTFSIALFNSGDAVGKISGIVYTLVSLSTMVYGMGLYYRRRELICARAPGPYDDTTGPTIICFALLFAVALNAYLKFTVKNPSLFYL